MKLNVIFESDWNNQLIQDAIYNALQYENINFDCSVEVVVVSKEQIKDINNQTRGINKVTDVLSYPMFESVDDMCADADGFVFLGSMVICADKALEQANEYGHSSEREICFLAVHSILHLLGYDHVTSKEDEQEMFYKQEQILLKMGQTR